MSCMQAGAGIDDTVGAIPPWLPGIRRAGTEACPYKMGYTTETMEETYGR